MSVEKSQLTRKHSSGMRTARLLTMAVGGCVRGVHVQEGGCMCPRGCVWGLCREAVSRGLCTTPWTQRQTHPPPPVNRMTDTGKNIILSQTSFAGSNNVTFRFIFRER